MKLPINDEIKFNMINSYAKNIYKAKDVIYKEGHPSTWIYLIKDFEIKFLKNGSAVKTAKKYQYFWENSLLKGNKRSMYIVEKTNCVIYTISNEFFENQFEEDFKEQLNLTLLRIAFSESANFKSINGDILNKIFKNFSLKTFSKKICEVLDGNRYK